MWADDHCVYPPEGGWFGHFDEQGTLMLPRELGAWYDHDLLGIKTLDQRGDLMFYKTPGEHMTLTSDMISDYLLPMLDDLLPYAPTHYKGGPM